MAKRVVERPDWLEASQVRAIYSVSGCVSEEFADYLDCWKHNGFWLFDSPAKILEAAQEKAVSLEGAKLFYYEAYELEFDEKQMSWCSFAPASSIETNVAVPEKKRLEGFDLITFFARTSPECSPLSCNGLAKDIPTNEHCLFPSFDEAKIALEDGKFGEAEPGPYRIFAVYSVDWAES